MENSLPFFLDTLNPLSEEIKELFEQTYDRVKSDRFEFITPEHLLISLLQNENFEETMNLIDGDIDFIENTLKDYLKNLDKVPEGISYSPSPSLQFLQMVKYADQTVSSCGKTTIEMSHIIKAIFSLEESMAAYALNEATGGDQGLFLNAFLDDERIDSLDPEDYDEDFFKTPLTSSSKEESWKKLVTCVNDIYQEQNPLIGREEELKKTITVLCRKDKNNPLHIGEPGVGKTALVYGLAKLIEEGKVPDKLKGAKIYKMDLGSLIAGTQYRGDFEKRIKNIMDGAGREGNAIIYIDEIHNLNGAGAVGESSMDASNILKPYLETGKIKFIGATTYDDYKRHFAKSKSIIRRFSNIEIPEPSIQETINILRQLQPHYETFHNVKFADEAIEYAVKGSAKHINDRFLPDKAIDLLDESGALKQIEEEEENVKIVDKELVSKVLAKICRVESLAMTDEEPLDLKNLNEKISSQLFGQKRAVDEVTESILMSKAGLNDDNKPIASLLFVGPTGVGKTELARLLSKELGIELIRFDMSEYTEKHTVAKLIGSPAGYVGYEDGGLLTDAIRKSPNAVLLLDEIEKAHPDIYNILLQVMDYAKLTDNKGNKADFRNVVLIMTSNAGAQYASQANIGFANNTTQGEAMLKQVKKTFKPEFINRLSATVVFNDMSKDMASQILEKKINELKDKLLQKGVSMKLSDKAVDYLLKKGFTKEYGAREIDRVIHQELKKVLMKEILFGDLKKGGDLTVDIKNGNLEACLNQK